MTVDMREIFVIDSIHYQGNLSPVIIRIQHARLRHVNCVIFELVFQTVLTLLVLSIICDTDLKK